jgi:uncharacterized protein (DUF58 family)
MSQVIHQPTGARYLAPEILAKINSLELIARSVVEGFISGLHRSPHLGFSTDFAEHRQYMPGDDVRHLDWKLLARTDRLYIKKYQADTNTQITILLDASASMNYASGEVTKMQYAQFLASSLAYLGVRQHDSVGLDAFNEEIIEHIPPLSRTGHLRSILGVIERVQAGKATRLSEQLHRVADRLKRRGVVVLISDLYDDPASIIQGLEHMRFRGNEVIVFHLMDKQELDFDFADAVVLEDSETEEQLHVIPDALRDEYRRAIQTHIDALREGTTRNRIDYELLRTSEPLDLALSAYLNRRAMA